MTSEQALAALQVMLPSIRNEMQITRRVLAAVPDNKASYTVHEKNMTAGTLAQHIASSEAWFLSSIIAGEFKRTDLDDLKKWESLKPSEVVIRYDEQIPTLLAEVGQLTGEQLARPVQFHVYTFPAVTYLNFMNCHTIHHRGQLSVYLRPMGAKVPSIYGGSADEPLTEAAAQS